jgi:5-methylcytosine-specific restriction endonuclease McrA
MIDEYKQLHERISSIQEQMIPHNGIDRKNNSLEYTLENCVPCCRQCNFAKQGLSEIEF